MTPCPGMGSDVSGRIGGAGQVVEGVTLDSGADKRNQSFDVEAGDVVHAGDPAGQAESDDLAGDELGAQLGAVGAEVGDDRREDPGGDEVAEGFDVTALAKCGMDDRREAVRPSLVPQADDGAHDPLPQLFGLELGDGGRPVHEVGVDPGGRLDDGLGEERGSVREVVVDQGRVDAGVARDAAQGGLVAVAGEGGAGRRQDGLARVRATRRPPPSRAHRSLVSLIVRACPRSTPLGSSRATLLRR